MDLTSVLATGTDDLGHSALNRYFAGIFASYLPAESYEGAFRVRATLNFAVQQLATRSRIDRAHERYLHIGGRAPDDLAASLIHAMPHTDVNWQQGESGPDADAVKHALAAVRAQLPPDGMPENIRFNDENLPQGCFGLITVFGTADLEALHPLLNPQGRILHVDGNSVARIALGRCGTAPPSPHRPNAMQATDERL